MFDDPVAWFRHLRDQINLASGFAWDANPWVWVIAFKLVSPAAAALSR